MFEATKEFRFEMAHVLSNYNGPCGNLHGHSYKCLVTMGSKFVDDEKGMVIDFSILKGFVNNIIIDKLDHACAFNTNTTDPFELDLLELCKKHNKKIIEFPFRTTAENMSKYIYQSVNELLNKIGFKCIKVELYETTTGHATYTE